MTIRVPAVAGRFYQASPFELSKLLSQWLITPDKTTALPRALIVPHAGYIFSGKVAARAYRWLKRTGHLYQKVILIGPSHYYAFEGCALPSVQYFATPLGHVQIDVTSVEKLSHFDDIVISDHIHELEHCLEVQLPFLQSCLPEFTLLPILTGDISPIRLAEILDTLWQNNTLLVISSDLSHYHPYADAQDIDHRTLKVIEKFDPSLTPQQACGATGINTLLLLAKQRGYDLKQVEYKNSGDMAAGDKERVVGYVSYLVSAPGEASPE
ncbi:AmmeMemoRadiSam system protein B [Photobacterium galatheae]|uniref:MEMO1 family protein EA58_03590 n=1 Tax=Photobacterium galatheae TaxID=1654360 RepID=A0A066RYU1_9GAMM|nr:AmmeMemoRadiSam system protein B [Photobacterium galatheae]KDM92852.1 dioxygenase [Photobacterium galatheae]MCM0148183.1 AmmeMemoRadiSam system protein B [Photobacterium galatheae]